MFVMRRGVIKALWILVHRHVAEPAATRGKPSPGEEHEEAKQAFSVRVRCLCETYWSTRNGA